MQSSKETTQKGKDWEKTAVQESTKADEDARCEIRWSQSHRQESRDMYSMHGSCKVSDDQGERCRADHKEKYQICSQVDCHTSRVSSRLLLYCFVVW